MDTAQPVTVFMWKEALLLMALIFVLSIAWSNFFMWRYQKAVKRFYDHQWTGLIQMCSRLRKLSAIAEVSLNGWIYIVRGQLSLISASVAFCEGDSKQFVRNLMEIPPKGAPHTMRCFLLALYYRSENNAEQVERWCREFEASDAKDANQIVVMECVFSDCALKNDPVVMEKILSVWRNPAILKLIQANI